MSSRNKPDEYGLHPDRAPPALRYNQTAHTFEVFGNTYKCHPLTPLEQIHIGRRLAPIAIGALRADAGQEMILSRLTKLASLLNKAEGKAGLDLTDQQVTGESMDLAEGVFSAFAEVEEEKLNDIIRKCMKKIARVSEGGGVSFMWNDTHDMPTHQDIDGFKTLTLVGLYLFAEFKERIAEFVESLGHQPGPILAAMSGTQPRPPGAPGVA